MNVNRLSDFVTMQLLKKQLCLNAVRGRDSLVWDHLTRGLLGNYSMAHDGAWPTNPEHEESKQGAVYLLSKHKLAEIIYGSPKACCDFAMKFAVKESRRDGNASDHLVTGNGGSSSFGGMAGSSSHSHDTGNEPFMSHDEILALANDVRGELMQTESRYEAAWKEADAREKWEAGKPKVSTGAPSLNSNP